MRVWTDREVEHLLRLRDERLLPWPTISLKMGRSIPSVQHKYANIQWNELPAARPTPEMLADAAKRLTAARSLTAWIVGDPAPGFSALDRRGDGHLGR